MVIGRNWLSMTGARREAIGTGWMDGKEIGGIVFQTKRGGKVRQGYEKEGMGIGRSWFSKAKTGCEGIGTGWMDEKEIGGMAFPKRKKKKRGLPAHGKDGTGIGRG